MWKKPQLWRRRKIFLGRSIERVFLAVGETEGPCSYSCFVQRWFCTMSWTYGILKWASVSLYNVTPTRFTIIFVLSVLCPDKMLFKYTFIYTQPLVHIRRPGHHLQIICTFFFLQSKCCW